MIDSSRFGDPIADLTSWDPTRKTGAINRGFRPVLVHSGRLEFRARLETMLGYVFFIMLGAGLGAASLAMPRLGVNVILLLVGLCIAGAGVLMLYQSTTPIVFDKQSGVFWKGRQAPGEAFPDRPVRSHARLDDIHALQIIAKYSSESRFSYSYLTHEMNLVFKDGEREHVFDGTGLARIRMDTQTLGLFLEKPVWDATINLEPVRSV